MQDIENLENELLMELLQDIRATNDPVEQYRAMERYHKFCEARAIRVATDAPCSGKAKR